MCEHYSKQHGRQCDPVDEKQEFGVLQERVFAAVSRGDTPAGGVEGVGMMLLLSRKKGGW